MLLHMCSRFQENECMLNLLGQMRELGLAPNSMTVNTLSTSFTGDRARLEQALSSFPAAANQALEQDPNSNTIGPQNPSLTPDMSELSTYPAGHVQ